MLYEEPKETKIIAAFVGCGKTDYANHHKDNTLIVEANSNHFVWTDRVRTPKEIERIVRSWHDPASEDAERYRIYLRTQKVRARSLEFPSNYINYIKENIGKVDIILISTHPELLHGLKKEGLEYTLIYPSRDLKEEWVGKLFLRNTPVQECKYLADNWDYWIDNLEEIAEVYHLNSIVLKHGDTFEDALNNLSQKQRR